MNLTIAPLKFRKRSNAQFHTDCLLIEAKSVPTAPCFIAQLRSRISNEPFSISQRRKRSASNF